jgi:hypothetical protein
MGEVNVESFLNAKTKMRKKRQNLKGPCQDLGTMLFIE